MWHDNLLRLIKESNLTIKQISERGNLPYETVKRVVSGKTPNPYIDTLDHFAVALNCELKDILIDTKIVGVEEVTKLQEQIDNLTLTIEQFTAEKNLLLAETALQKDKITLLNAENDLLKLQLKHKDEIIAIHNYYNKIKPTE